MRMNGNVRLILVLGMLVLASLQVAGAETAQSWHLLSDDEGIYSGTKANDGTDHHYDLYMNKTGNATGTSMLFYNITADKDNTTWWYAEYPAQVDGVTFGEDNWIVNISHGPTEGCTIWANVSKVNDSTGEVTYLANGSVSNLPTDQRVTIITCYDVDETTQVFNTSERLALRIYHNRTIKLTIYYYNATRGYYSNLTSPSSDPGYPVPELSTLILFSTGLIALAGYVLLTRRRK